MCPSITFYCNLTMWAKIRKKDKCFHKCRPFKLLKSLVQWYGNLYGNNHTHFQFVYIIYCTFSQFLAQCKSTYTSSYTQGGR